MEPSGHCQCLTTSSLDIERRSREPISADVERRILHVLAERVRPSSGQSEADTASHLLLRLCRLDSREAFVDMTRSPLGKIRERGVLGLRALGEEPPAVDPATPVAFRVLIDGAPAAGVTVAWRVSNGQGGATSSQLIADDEGVVRLHRDLFLDPRSTATQVQLSAASLENASAPWFSADLSVPEDLDVVTTLEVVTQPITLSVGGGAAGARVEVSSKRTLNGVTEDFWSLGKALAVPASGKLRLPRLAQGAYRFSVTWPDGSTWSSGDVSVGEAPVALVATRSRSARR